MSLTLGTRIGAYEILSAIGAGGMGEVYRARDTKLNRDVAIKVLPPAFANDPDRLARFTREAQTLAALNHPNVAAIYGLEGDALVMELLDGETLRERLTSAPTGLPVRKTIDIAVQLARGLAAAHDQGLVHRDIKPDNIFLLNDGQVKILDFGLARQAMGSHSGATETVAAMTEPGMVMGTVGYMAPEQVRGHAVDGRTDLFAFGAVLYEMLSGQRAFHRDTSAETMTAILKDDPPEITGTRAEISPSLDRIVRHCLEKNPIERFQTARDVAFALGSLSVSSASSSRLDAPAMAPSRRLPLTTVAVTVVALAIGILAGRVMWKSAPSALPSYHALTFGRGPIASARFAPDGQTILYAAAWDGTRYQMYSIRAESPASSPLSLPTGRVESVSASGNMLVLNITQQSIGWTKKGTLSETPLTGSALRDLLEDVGGADWAPDGRSMAVVLAPDWKYRLEFPVGHVLYETTSWISHPRVSPAGDVVAFVDHPVFGDDTGSIAIVDRSGKKTIVWPSTGSAQGVAWSSSGEEIWFSAGEAGRKSLYAVTRSGRQRAVSTNTGDMTIQDISRDGRLLFVQENSRVGFLGLLPGETRERDLSGLDWSETPLLSDDGKTLVFTEQGVGGGPGNAVYLRHLDGSAPVRLGQGNGLGFSPDKKWVVMAVKDSTQPNPIALMPTGAGELKMFPRDNIDRESGDFVRFLPDGKRILFNGNEPGRRQRAFVQDLVGGSAQPVTPEGVTARLVSTDGTSVLIRTAGGPTYAAMAPLDGGPSRPIRGLEAGDRPLGWADDGHTIFVGKAPLGELVARVFRVNIDTGRRELWRELSPADPAGMRFLQPNAISADGKTIIFLYNRTLAELYVADGIK